MASGGSCSGSTSKPTGAPAAAVAAESVTVTWMADDASSTCLICKADFSFLNRRHHCRYCGRLVCKDCMKKTFKFEVIYPTTTTVESKSATKIQAIFRGKKTRRDKLIVGDRDIHRGNAAVSPSIQRREGDGGGGGGAAAKDQNVCDECYHTLEMLYLDEDEEKEEDLKMNPNGSSLTDKIKQGYKKAYKAIIQPELRRIYDDSELGLKQFSYLGKSFERIDFEVKNKRFHVLKASIWRPVGAPKDGSLPCVLYLHDYCMNRLSAIHQHVVHVALSMGYSICAFDFSGSGVSEGRFTTLGYFERDDISPVCDHLMKEGLVSKNVVLWGDGMGAAATCLHIERLEKLSNQQQHAPNMRMPTISAVVLDSVFPKLITVIWDGVEKAKAKYKEEAKEEAISIPDTVVFMGLSLMKSGIKADADFDVDDINPIYFIDKCPKEVPIFFLASSDHPVINSDYSKDIYSKYKGVKKQLEVASYVPGPESQRPRGSLMKIRDFLCTSLGVGDNQLLSSDVDAIFSSKPFQDLSYTASAASSVTSFFSSLSDHHHSSSSPSTSSHNSHVDKKHSNNYNDLSSLTAAATSIFNFSSQNNSNMPPRPGKAHHTAPSTTHQPSPIPYSNISNASTSSYHPVNTTDIESQHSGPSSPYFSNHTTAPPNSSTPNNGPDVDLLIQTFNTNMLSYIDNKVENGSFCQKLSLVPLCFLLVAFYAFYYLFKCLDSLVNCCLKSNKYLSQGCCNYKCCYDSSRVNPLCNPYEIDVYLACLGYLAWPFVVASFVSARVILYALSLFSRPEVEEMITHFVYISPFSNTPLVI